VRFLILILAATLTITACSDQNPSSTATSAVSSPTASGAASDGAPHVRDLPKGDPDRQQILDAVRKIELPRHDGKLKFVVRDLFRDGDAAYLCALLQEDGQLERTDEDFDVGRWGLRKRADGWHAADVGGGLAERASHVDCRISDREITSRGDIIAAISAARQSSAASTGASPNPSNGQPAALTENQAIDRVLGAIKKHRLTSLRAECLDFFFSDESATTYSIDVHEQHDAKCGGDPATSPRLFSFEVNKTTGAMKTDALDISDPRMQPIK
jgi:hypothetical protein